MPTSNDILTDDYVAALLAKDAKDISSRSAFGLLSDSPSKPANRPKPKPNTRFLQNIIRDTDSHNAALLAKEASESRARLRSLSQEERKEEETKTWERVSEGQGRDIRKRQLGAIAAILGSSGAVKRKRTFNGEKLESRKEERRQRSTSSEQDESTREAKKRKKREMRGRHKEATIEDTEEKYSWVNGESQRDPRSRDNGQNDDDRENRRRRSHSKEGGVDKEDRYTKRHRRHRSSSRDRRKERDSDEKRRRHHPRSRSSHKHRTKDSGTPSRSPQRIRSRSREKSHRSRRLPPPACKTSKLESKQIHDDEEYDSDPLSAIIGPIPPPTVPQVHTRGRGTTSHYSGIDSRFSVSYDPSADVHLDTNEDDDWDQALEALQDRQKWRQQGADRLRAAGFTEEEVGKWEKGETKREEDVKWVKHGEGREWDRGKIIGADGAVAFEPAFGRLKDN